MRSSDWLRACPLNADRLTRSSLRPGTGRAQPAAGEAAPSPASFAQSCGRRGSRGQEPAGRAVSVGLGLCGGAEPGQWAHEEEERGNGLLSAPPQTGAGKRGAGARAGCAPDGYLASPDPGSPDARGRRKAEEEAGRGRARAGRGQGLSRGKRATRKLEAKIV